MVALAAFASGETALSAGAYRAGGIAAIAVWATRIRVIGDVPTQSFEKRSIRTLKESRRLIAGAGSVNADPELVVEPFAAMLVRAADHALAIAAVPFAGKAAASVDQIAVIVAAVLAAQIADTLRVRSRGDRIDAALVTVPEVPRAPALFQSRRTDAGSVLTKMVAGANRVASSLNALAVDARCAGTAALLRGAAPSAAVRVAAALPRAGRGASWGRGLLLFLLAPFALGSSLVRIPTEEGDQRAADQHAREVAARPADLSEATGECIKAEIVQGTPYG
jgi:hypothetical protein